MHTQQQVPKRQRTTPNPHTRDPMLQATVQLTAAQHKHSVVHGDTNVVERFE